MQYYKRGENIDPEKHNIGRSPNFSVLNSARANVLHHAVYNRNRELLNYSGCPEFRFGDGSISGDYDCEYYIVFPVRGVSGDKIKIGFSMTTWDDYDSTGNCNFKWDGVDAPNLDGKNVIQSYEQSSSQSSAGYTQPNGITVTDEIEVDYDHNDIGGYGSIRLSFEHLVPASFVSWIRPIDESDYNALDSTYGTQAFNLTESTFNIGQTLRGSSSYNDTNGSLGTLCQRQFDDDSDGANMVSSSELCMFQWGHPAGLYASSTAGAEDVDIFGYDIRIKGRELLDSSTGYFDLVIVALADSLTELKVYVSSTSTTHTVSLNTNTGSIATVAQAFTKIPFDASRDFIRIYCAVPNTTSAVEVKTLAIFESTY